MQTFIRWFIQDFREQSDWPSTIRLELLGEKYLTNFLYTCFKDSYKNSEKPNPKELDTLTDDNLENKSDLLFDCHIALSNYLRPLVKLSPIEFEKERDDNYDYSTPDWIEINQEEKQYQALVDKYKATTITTLATQPKANAFPVFPRFLTMNATNKIGIAYFCPQARSTFK